MNNVIAAVPTAEEILSMGDQSFEYTIRGDGTGFFRIAEGTTDEERTYRLWLADTVQALHNGEQPNDWRYQIIRDLFYSFLNYTGYDSSPWDWDALRDVVPEIADRHTTAYTSELFQWLADCPSRAEFNDDSFIEPTRDLSQLVTARQYEEIESMAFNLLNACSIYQAELAKLHLGEEF